MNQSQRGGKILIDGVETPIRFNIFNLAGKKVLANIRVTEILLGIGFTGLSAYSKESVKTRQEKRNIV